MKYKGNKIAVHWIFIILIGFFFSALSGCGGGSAGDGDNQPGVPASITVSSGATTLPAEANRSTYITAVLKDTTGASVDAYTSVLFQTNLGAFQNGTQEYKAQTLDESGQITVPFLAGTIPGTAQIIVTSNKISQKIEIQLTDTTPPVTSVASISLTSQADTILADGVDRTIIYATVMDTNGNKIANQKVDFTTTHGSFASTGNQVASNTTDDSGMAKVVLVSGTASGTAEVKAYAEGISKSINIGFTSKPTLLVIAASQTSVKTDNSDRATITAMVLDDKHVPAQGVMVAFRSFEQSSLLAAGQISASSVITDADGTAVIYFSSGIIEKKNQTVMIEATVGAQTQRIPVQVTGTYIEFAVQGGNSNLVIGGNSVQLTTYVRDASGAPIYNAPVQFSINPDYLNVQYYSTNTDVLGQFKADIGAKAGNTGKVDLTASAMGAKATTKFTVNEPEKIFRIILPDTESVSLDTNVWQPIQVQSPDYSKVNFVTTFGKFEGSGTNFVQVDTVQGIATTNIRADLAGTATVQAYADIEPSMTDSVTIVISAPPSEASKISLQAPANMPPSTPVVKSSVTVTAVVRNDNNQPVGNAPVSFSIENPVGGETLVPALVFTDSYGKAVATFTAGELGSDANGVTVVAKIQGKAISDQRQISITGTPASVTLGMATIVESINNDTRYRLPMTVTVTDPGGHPVKNTKISLDLWAKEYHKGGWTEDCKPYWYPYTPFPSEDVNKNNRLDPGEDTNGDGVLTPEASAAGSVVPEVVTNDKGVAEFDLEYQKEMAVWVTVELTATTSIVQGTEVRTTRTIEPLPYAVDDACHLSASPFNESEHKVEMLIEANPTKITADGSSTSEIKVMVRNTNNNPVSGTTVNLSSNLGTVTGMAITGEDGYAYINGQSGNWPVLRSERRNGIATVTATAEEYVGFDGNTAKATADVSFSGVTLSLSASSESLTTGDVTTLTAQLKSPSAAPISGQKILFTIANGLGNFNGNATYTGTTGAEGSISVPFTSSSAGTETITAYHLPTKGQPGETKGSVRIFISGKKLTITPATHTLLADGASTMAINLKLEDDAGAVAGQMIQLSTTLGRIDATVVTNANGEATAILTSGMAIGLAVITAIAELPDHSIVSATNSDISFVSGAPATLQVITDPSIVPINNGISNITVLVRDSRGNPVGGVLVNFAILSGPGGGEIITPAVARTSGPGTSNPGQVNAVFSAGSLGSAAPNDIIIEVSAGGHTKSTALTISGKPSHISLGTSLKDVANNNDGSYSIPVAAIISDVNGISVPAGYIVSFSTGNPELGTFISPKQTNDEGKAITKLTYPATKLGQKITISASCGGVLETVSFDLPIIGGGVADVDLFVPSTILADDMSKELISATAKDKDGNYLYPPGVILPPQIFSFETNTKSDFTGETAGNIFYSQPDYFVTADVGADDSPHIDEFISSNYDLYIRAESGGVYSEVKKITAKGITLTAWSEHKNLVANGYSTTTITATLKETATGLPLAGKELKFGSTNGFVYKLGDSGKPLEKIITDASGMVQVTYRTNDSNLADPEDAVVRIYYTTEVFVSTQIALAGKPSVAQIFASANKYTLYNSPDETSIITAQVLDAESHSVTDGQLVTFTITSGAGQITESATTLNGLATGIFTATPTTGPVDIVIKSGLVSTTPPLRIEIIGSRVGSISLSAGTGQIVANEKEVVIRATVLDTKGNPASGFNVKFNTSLGTLLSSSGAVILPSDAIMTDFSGVAEVKLKSGTIAGTALVTATAEGFVGTVSIGFTPDIPDNGKCELLISPNAVNPGGSAEAIITVKDANENRIAGETVTFSITQNQSGGSLSAISALTDANGQARITYTAGSGSGTDNITATITSIGIQKEATVTVDAASVVIGSISVISGSAELVANGVSTTAIRARVLDIGGNPIPNKIVLFETTAGDLGGGDVSASEDKTDADGYAQVTLTAPSNKGTTTVRAIAGGFSATVNINCIAGPAHHFIYYVYPQTVQPGGMFHIEAWVEDAYNNRLTNEYVTFIIRKVSDNTIVETRGEVTAADNIVRMDFTALWGDEDLKVILETNNGTTETFTVTVDPAAVVVDAVTMTAVPTTVVADGANVSTVTVLVTDQFGNAVANTLVTLTTNLGDLDIATPGPQTVTTPTTNASGEIIFDLVSKDVGTAQVTATVGGKIATATVNFVAGALDAITLSAAPNNLTADGSSTSIITATAVDALGHPVADGWAIDFSVAAGSTGTLSTLSALTKNGTASVTYTAGTTAGAVTIHAESADDGTINDNVTITLLKVFVHSMNLSVTSENIVADGNSQTAVRVTLNDKDGDPISGIKVEFTASFGSLSDPEANTNFNGVAEVLLTSDTRAGVALVMASAEGFSDTVHVKFIPGPPVDAKSSITANPASIPADGTSTTTVTVTLADEFGNPVSDATSVTLYTSAGTITSSNPATTASGRASFTLTSAGSSGMATLYVQEYRYITSRTISFGTLASGTPSSILVGSISQSEIAVTGVGQNDNTAVTVRLVDETGNTVIDPKYFVTVSLLARPNGGEVLGGELNGTLVSGTESITVSTKDGVATFNLRSGVLPGVVEIMVEAKTKDSGPPIAYDSLAPRVVTVIPQISIASGPPQTIALSAPTVNAVINLNNGEDNGLPQTPGFYSRKAGLIVTDKYGNAVADGTVVNLGMIDTVIADGITGKTTAGDNALTDTTINFTTQSVVRNGVDRSILPNDRVVIFNTNAQDKSRFVSDAPFTVNDLYVTKDYTKSYIGLRYAVGASLLGGAIYGIDTVGGVSAATKGTVKTLNGLAPIRLVYPAKKETIHTEVISVFTSSDDSASLVDDTTLVFASIAPWKLTAIPTEISYSSPITLTLVDGGDQVPLPFISVQAFVVIKSGTDGVISPLDVTATSGATNADGLFTSTITINTPGNPKDTATITYYAGDASVKVAYTEP